MGRTHARRGLTLVEAMLLVVIMSIVAMGAGIGLQAVAKVPTEADKTMAINAKLVDTLETWKSKSWSSMASGGGTVTVNGKGYELKVTVENADPTATTDPATFDATKVQTDFRRITAEIDGRKMRVYVAQP